MKKKQLKTKVQNAFESQFHQKPHLVFAPGRINLIGEHTDYNEGYCLPAAVDKGIVLGLYPSEQDYSTFLALDINAQFNGDIQKIQPVKHEGWINYILGVIQQIQKRDVKLPQLNIVFAGNIPMGSGMSSSAALANSAVFAINSYFSLGLSRKTMVEIAQQAEQQFADVQCGIMDQYASMFGEKDSALWLDCRSVTHKVIPVNLKGYQILLINTNVKHNLAESAYNKRRKVCEKVARQLGVVALRDLSLNDINTSKKDLLGEDYLKAKYIIEEHHRVKEFVMAVERGDLKHMGNLMFLSHAGLKQLYDVSCEALDFLVDLAKHDQAVLGARMMGGGFGGCTINLIKKSAVRSFKTKVAAAYKRQFGKSCSFYNVKFSQGTHQL